MAFRSRYRLQRFNHIFSSIFLERELVGFHSINSFFLDIEYNSFQIPQQMVQLYMLLMYLSIHAINTWEPRRAHFPTNILRCTTLVNLKLCHLSVDTNFPFTLPSLKTLLAGCPALRDLQASHLYFGESVPFDFQQFESSSLKMLNRADILPSIIAIFR